MSYKCVFIAHKLRELIAQRCRIAEKRPITRATAAVLHEVLAMTPQGKRKGYVLPLYAEIYSYRNDKGRPTKKPDISNEIQTHFINCGIREKLQEMTAENWRNMKSELLKADKSG